MNPQTHAIVARPIPVQPPRPRPPVVPFWQRPGYNPFEESSFTPWWQPRPQAFAR